MNDAEIRLQVQLDDKKANSSLDNLSKKSETLSKSFEKAGKVLTVGLTIPIAGLITAGVKYNSTVETLTTSFKVMTGSAEEAADIVSQLKEIGAKTPYEFTGLADTVQLLMQYGQTSKQAIAVTKMVGDVSQGSAEKMNSIALAYGQMSSAGKVNLMDVKQMITAGFNPLQIISDKTGESMASLYDRISKGTMSVQEITDAFTYATSEGGKFYGSSEEQSKTLSGRLSTLKDNFNEATGSLTKSLIPALENLVDKFTKIANWIANLDDKQKKNILTILKIIAVVGPLLLLIGKGIELFLKIQKVAKIFNMTTLAFSGTIGLIVIGIVALIAIIYLLIKNWDKIKEVVSKSLSAIGQFFSNIWDNIKTFFSNIFTSIGTFFSNIWNAIVSFMTPIISFIAGIFKKIAEIIMWPINIIKNLFILIIAIIAMGLQAIYNFIKPIAIWIWDNVLNPVFNFISKIFNSIVNFISGIIESIKNIFLTIVGFIWNNILSPIFNFFASIFGAIWGVISGVIDKVKNGFMIAVNFVKGLFNNLRDAISTIFGVVAGIIKAPINGVIGLINVVLKSLNKIKVPSWVPGLGGMKVNFPLIPKLEVGTNMVQQEGLAYLHQGEAVVPKKYNPAMGGNIGQYATIQISMGDINMDGNKVGKAVTPYITKTVKLGGGNI